MQIFTFTNERHGSKKICCGRRFRTFSRQLTFLLIGLLVQVGKLIKRNCRKKNLKVNETFFPFQILLKVGIAVYEALDFNLPQDEECILSQDLHDLISLMTAEGN